uniref:Uncharacterized protein n=1 Tax=Oryza glumipatula TaxID=40148 RepID=A0A0E0AKP0_9ORYZ
MIKSTPSSVRTWCRAKSGVRGKCAFRRASGEHHSPGQRDGPQAEATSGGGGARLHHLGTACLVNADTVQEPVEVERLGPSASAGVSPACSNKRTQALVGITCPLLNRFIRHETGIVQYHLQYDTYFLITPNNKGLVRARGQSGDVIPRGFQSILVQARHGKKRFDLGARVDELADGVLHPEEEAATIGSCGRRGSLHGVDQLLRLVGGLLHLPQPRGRLFLPVGVDALQALAAEDAELVLQQIEHLHGAPVLVGVAAASQVETQLADHPGDRRRQRPSGNGEFGRGDSDNDRVRLRHRERERAKN